ncbi:rRNA maturation RNase YbeY [Atopobacter phocae]|uniref:rRNA maturation RNase YbeY n=1 Tax=Atopobacter phocae TaxID=136492 RepID=UPI00047027EA|nr:rRNA maturation RNase YbeY [Atopobacter phocae]
MQIDFMDEMNLLTTEQADLIQNVLTFASEELKLSDRSECSVTIVTNERIQEINAEYRGIDRPTDVISFAMDDPVEGELMIDFDDEELDLPHHYGDIIISIERAKEQAEEYGHGLYRELGFLAVHGFLHLMGYDHQTPEDEKVMFGLQKELLNAYGLEK